MATTLDDEYRKTLAEFARGANGANETFALNTIRIVSANLDGDADIWTLSAAEAEERAKRYRLISAYALRGAAICDDHAKAHSAETLVDAVESVRAVMRAG